MTNILLHNRYYNYPKMSDEDFSNKVDNLDFYLQDILSRHEIVASDDFLQFLDPESALFEQKNASWKEKDCISVYQIILQDVPAVDCKMKNEESTCIDICVGQIIMWKFHTFGYQTDFTLQMNGISKMTYVSCNYNEFSECGAFKADESGVITLKWTAAYSTRTYSARAYGPSCTCTATGVLQIVKLHFT